MVHLGGRLAATFTCGRTASWRAHPQQKRLGKLVRPAAIYVGPDPRSPEAAEGWDQVAKSEPANSRTSNRDVGTSNFGGRTSRPSGCAMAALQVRNAPTACAREHSSRHRRGETISRSATLETVNVSSMVAGMRRLYGNRACAKLARWWAYDERVEKVDDLVPAIQHRNQGLLRQTREMR